LLEARPPQRAPTATTYYFYPYWDDMASALECVSGGAGSPTNAQKAKTNLSAQRQSLQGLLPLSQGAIVATTTSSGAGGESWTRIQRLEARDADTFILLHFSNEESLDVPPHHIFTLGDGSPMRAERLCLSDVFVGRFGHITLKRIEAVVEDGRIVTVICEPTHQFFAGRHAASVLTRNYTFSS
jgi:hypothetical protein